MQSSKIGNNECNDESSRFPKQSFIRLHSAYYQRLSKNVPCNSLLRKENALGLQGDGC